ncbi:MAG: diacylglycerol kinase family protein [Flavobacteriia bacterium]|nr:diacylglycerol kinase family protein [Flavobacteriia bacterium]
MSHLDWRIIRWIVPSSRNFIQWPATNLTICEILKKTAKRFYHAAAGLKTHLKKGGNFRIQLAIGMLSLLLGALLNINTQEWLFLTLFIAGVLALETINSSIEALCDTVTLEHNEGIKNSKDLAAGAVLLFSLAFFSRKYGHCFVKER